MENGDERPRYGIPYAVISVSYSVTGSPPSMHSTANTPAMLVSAANPTSMIISESKLSMGTDLTAVCLPSVVS